jgi:hypothetical protein
MSPCRNEATASHRARPRRRRVSRLEVGQISMGGIPVDHRRSFYTPGRETDRGGTVSDRAAPSHWHSISLLPAPPANESDHLGGPDFGVSSASSWDD